MEKPEVLFMSQAKQALPKITDLGFDPKTGCHFVALPSCVRRSDADAFRKLTGPIFEFLKNSGNWITERGLTAVPGITTKTPVIIVAHDLFDMIKSLFYDWLEKFLRAKATTGHKARAASA